MKRVLFAIVAFAMTCNSAWAIKFKSDNFHWKAVADRQYYIDLNDFVVETESGVPIYWGAQGLPKWMKLDATTGVISGLSKEQTTEMFTLTVVQGNSADAVNVEVYVESVNAHIKNNPVWMMPQLEILGCLGHPIATRDLAYSVSLANPGSSLPLPAIELSAVGKPSWVVEVRKPSSGIGLRDDSFYLTGMPPALGDYKFELKACAAGLCNSIPVTAKIKAQCE